MINSASTEVGIGGQAHESFQKLPTSEISSSITFAVLIYTNVFFSLAYFLGNLSIIIEKLTSLQFSSNLQLVLLLPCYIIWVLGELARFYFAYIGNLKERVPQMSAFLLMTIFPQLPCVLYLGFYQEFIYPFDESTGAVMLVILVVELFFGYLTLHTLIQRQTAQFYRLCQEEEDEQRSKILS
ncbi:hypothetical protein TrLO_g12048 [Triparma laevis f. longispina]|uniref:Transmembrane protein 17 n=1 Tax=Triparma laevis f. longispina TaxID=1714387 RepID=A0A9W7EBQ4_9STRA|nr:hypothetical protein TrLO_g12048 [Triparma laevis f. longispina]